MDAARRVHYLAALGIDVWLPRVGGVSRSGEAAPLEEAGRPGDAAADGAAAGSRLEELAPADISREPPLADASEGSAESAAAWGALRGEVQSCTRCALHRTRTRAVFGVGDLRAQWLVVGEAPGAEEDRQGEPFVGRAGQLLDSMLKAIGLARGQNVYIANVLKSRPPGNRDPRPEEVAICLPYLHRQIELIRPVLILAVGRIAAQNLLATDDPCHCIIGRRSGRPK